MSNVHVPTPSVLPGDVDVSKYEGVSYPDWLNAPVHYGTTTPSLIDSPGSSPITLATPQGHDSFSDCGPTVKNEMFRQTDAVAFSDIPPGLRELGTFSPEYPPVNQDARLPHRLLSPGVFDKPIHAQPTYPPFHHHRLLEPPSASPRDIESSVSPKLEENLEEDLPSPSSDAQSDTSGKAATGTHDDRIEFLLEMRRKGHSYKEIKRMGQFKEAESTLRGRVRVMTKTKAERVRKPQWLPNDVSTLDSDCLFLITNQCFRSPFLIKLLNTTSKNPSGRRSTSTVGVGFRGRRLANA